MAPLLKQRKDRGCVLGACLVICGRDTLNTLGATAFDLDILNREALFFLLDKGLDLGGFVGCGLPSRGGL